MEKVRMKMYKTKGMVENQQNKDNNHKNIYKNKKLTNMRENITKEKKLAIVSIITK